MIKDLVRDAMGRESVLSTGLRRTDILIDHDSWENTTHILQTKLVSIKRILFYTRLSNSGFDDIQTHKYPIIIVGKNGDGKPVDVVICCPPFEIYKMLFESAEAAGNEELAAVVGRILLDRFMVAKPPAPVPKYERLIIRCFERNNE